jgi:Bacterial Ig-like domain
MALRQRWTSNVRRVVAAATTVSALVMGSVLVATPAGAAPLPAPYAAAAVGDVLTAQSTLPGGALATTDLVHSVASVDSTSATASTATSANLGLRVGPIGVGLSNTEVAPPTHTDSGSLASVGVPGVLSTGLLTYTDSVRWDGATSCVPTGTPLSSAVTQTAGASLSLLGVAVVETGVSSVATSTGLVVVNPTRDTRGIVATAQGSVAGLSLLDGAVTVSALQPSLTATATDGAATSATLSGSAVTVTGPAGPVTLAAGASVTVTVPLVGSVVLRLASNADVTVSGDTFSTTYLTATVSLLAGTGTVTLGILPLSVSATAPAGGIECDTTAPVVDITSPADGSTTSDTTPAVTGTSDVRSGTIDLVIDGGTPVTVQTDADGSWTHTPTTPLAEGLHTVIATATDGAGNSASDTVSFTVDVLPHVAITTPADGSSTNDSDPPITGTSTVRSGFIELVIDGGTPVTVQTDTDGNWTHTPTTPLAEGPHTVVATATDGQGNTATDTATFTVDATTPTGVTVTAPGDGSTTTDTTPDITGTTDPGVTVVVSLDDDPGVPVEADENGRWTLKPHPLSCGRHTVTATVGSGAGTAMDSSSFTVACPGSNDPSPDAPSSNGPASSLPLTGSDPVPLASAGLMLLALGVLLLRTARHRRLGA